MFVLLITLFLNGVQSVATNDQCYTATYSLTSDYTHEDLPLAMKKRMSKAARQHKKIYKIVQSSTHSFEQVDSIAQICGGQPVMVKPEVIIRAIGQESADYFYYPKAEQKCYTVQEPEYLDDWKITGPIPYENTDDRYFKAVQENSDDYVIFDSNMPVSHNLKLIREIPGLVVEASIRTQRMVLLEFKASSCDDLAYRLKQSRETDREMVRQADDIDVNDFMNPFTDLINSADFECVESF